MESRMNLMKLHFLILTLLVLISCGKKQENEQVCDMVCEASEYTLTTAEGELPSEALTFSTNLQLVNFNSAQAQKVQEAADLVKRVIATREFREAVLNHTFNGQKAFANNNGLTNLQIYDRILIGAEKLNLTKNNSMDVELELYYQDTSTIGYTYPSSTRIWMNTKYFNNYTPNQVAANLMHEWLHKLGFGHDSSATAQRPYSVPYAIGYLIRRHSTSL